MDDRYLGGVGTADDPATFLIISPEMIELGDLASMKENNKDAQPKLWADFYYKVVDDTPEFHGNMYLETSKKFTGNNDKCTYSITWTRDPNGDEVIDAFQVTVDTKWTKYIVFDEENEDAMKYQGDFKVEG